MNFEFQTCDLKATSSLSCDALVLLVPDAWVSANAGEPVATLIAQALAAGDLEAKAGKCLALYRHPLFAATRVVLVGAGDSSVQQLKKAALAGLGAAKGLKTQRVVLSLALLTDAAQRAGLAVAVAASAEAGYSYSTTLSKPVLNALDTVVLALDLPLAAGAAGRADRATLRAVFDQAIALAAGVAFAKEWANRPANFSTPTMLGDAALGLANARHTKVEVLTESQIAALGMGSFLAVARGSREAPRFIVLTYTGAAKSEAPTVLVGKGITFDTGGISIKPAGEMDEMKFDMCGAASVLGVFRALAGIQPEINVIGLIPSCENMPDGHALKPGDVVRSMSGQTIEVLNTDAEGRLILCDALTYAERFKPRAVIDIATLTGACVIALGAVRSGLFSTHDALAQGLLSAGEAAQDLCWRMPLDDDYAEGLKSNFADVANVGGRAGGAVTAAKFLQRFTKAFPWAHLDIAGTAWKSGTAKGATGRPVGLLLAYLMAQVPGTAPKAAKVSNTGKKVKTGATPKTAKASA
jgi:leucyl aminopeptidase